MGVSKSQEPLHSKLFNLLNEHHKKLLRCSILGMDLQVYQWRFLKKGYQPVEIIQLHSLHHAVWPSEYRQQSFSFRYQVATLFSPSAFPMFSVLLYLTNGSCQAESESSLWTTAIVFNRCKLIQMNSITEHFLLLPQSGSVTEIQKIVWACQG